MLSCWVSLRLWTIRWYTKKKIICIWCFNTWKYAWSQSWFIKYLKIKYFWIGPSSYWFCWIQSKITFYLIISLLFTKWKSCLWLPYRNWIDKRKINKRLNFNLRVWNNGLHKQDKKCKATCYILIPIYKLNNKIIVIRIIKIDCNLRKMSIR